MFPKLRELNSTKPVRAVSGDRGLCRKTCLFNRILGTSCETLQWLAQALRNGERSYDAGAPAALPRSKAGAILDAWQ